LSAVALCGAVRAAGDARLLTQRPRFRRRTLAAVRDGSAATSAVRAASRSLSLGLRPPQAAAEQRFLNDVQDQSSTRVPPLPFDCAVTARFGPRAGVRNVPSSRWAKAGPEGHAPVSNRMVVPTSPDGSTRSSARSPSDFISTTGRADVLRQHRDPVIPPRRDIVDWSTVWNDLHTVAARFSSPVTSREPRVRTRFRVAALGAHVAGGRELGQKRARREASRRTFAQITMARTTHASTPQAFDYSALPRSSLL